MLKMYKKKPEVGILILPGFGRVHENTVLVGDHFEQFKDHLERYIPSDPVPEPVAAVTVVAPIEAPEAPAIHVDLGTMGPEAALKLVETVKAKLEEKTVVTVVEKADKKSKGKK